MAEPSTGSPLLQGREFHVLLQDRPFHAPLLLPAEDIPLQATAVQAAATQAQVAHPAEAIQLPAAHAQAEADTLAEVDTQEEAAPVLHVQADLPPEGNRINASF